VLRSFGAGQQQPTTFAAIERAVSPTASDEFRQVGATTFATAERRLSPALADGSPLFQTLRHPCFVPGGSAVLSAGEPMLVGGERHVSPPSSEPSRQRQVTNFAKLAQRVSPRSSDDFRPHWRMVARFSKHLDILVSGRAYRRCRAPVCRCWPTASDDFRHHWRMLARFSEHLDILALYAVLSAAVPMLAGARFTLDWFPLGLGSATVKSLYL
jgi:hypothetical protein